MWEKMGRVGVGLRNRSRAALKEEMQEDEGKLRRIQSHLKKKNYGLRWPVALDVAPSLES